MMNYEEFKKAVQEEVLNYLPEEYKNREVVIKPVVKTNITLDGLTLIAPASEHNVSPTIYINHMYQEYMRVKDFTAVMEDFSDTLVSGFANALQFTKACISEMMSEEAICFQVINKEQNKDLLADVPNRDFLDLSIIYKYISIAPNGETASITITNSIAEMKGLTEEELFQLASINTKRLMPVYIVPMARMLAEMMDLDEEDIDNMMGEMPMHIITNSTKVAGATSMLYEEKLYELATVFESGFYLLPYSIHECIALPSSKATPEELARMVSEVHMNQVELHERLSNQVYYYDMEKRELTLATDTPNKRLDSLSV